MLNVETRRTAPWLAFVATIAIGMIVYAIAHRLGTPRTTWSNHAAGPLTCISDGRDMQCAATQFHVLPMPHGTSPGAQTPTAQDSAQLGCIALAVFTEARAESYLGQAAVAQTVVNRAEQARKSACDVVTSIAQYQGVEELQQDPWQIDAPAWQRALTVAEAVSTRDYDLGACATAVSFHARANDPPKWAAEMREVCRVGAHRFYAGEG